MRCPKCGFDQTEARECARCGIVVDRWRAGERARPVRSTPPPAARLRWSPALAALGLLVTAGVGWRVLSKPATPPSTAPISHAEPPALVASSDPELPAVPVEIPSEPLPALPPLAADAPVREAPLAGACPLSSGLTGSIPGRGPVSSSWREGARGFADAVQEQARVKAPLLVYFYTDWCPYCRELERTVLSDYGFDRYRAVRARVNPEAGHDERALANRFGVDAYPRVFLIASSSGLPVRISLSPSERKEGSSGFVSSEELLVRFDGVRKRAVAELARQGYDRGRGGDVAGAIQVLDEALAMDPDRAEAWLQRGMARQESGDTQGAYEDFRTAISLQRSYFDVYARVAFDLGQKGNWDAAAACWTAFLQDGPREGKAFLERSRAHAQRGDLRRAREDAEEACRLGEPAACGVATTLGG